MRRAAAGFAAAVVAAFVVAGLGSIVLPILVGYHARVIVTGSMEPHIHVGDIVVGHRVSPARVHVGDIVIFRDPGGSGRELAHRVIAVQAVGRRAAIATRGDANTTVERFSVPLSGHIGLITYRIPALGYGLAYAAKPAARIALVTIPALVLGFVELRRIWTTPEAAGAGAG
jgi:signal peptidase